MKVLVSVFILAVLSLQCSFGQKVKYAELKQSYPKVNWEARRSEAVKLLSDLLKIPSVRGNEIQVAKYIQTVLVKEGIPSRFVLIRNIQQDQI